ncbi:CubicO group peptidase, beta-lactamase class C family [Pedobacter westerhofensis]|uniref:Beta-lactamase n=1 Tax=Pedobacter westerhofensis TaxID=425512 RepID=A0A521CJJ0_9SPHI|nr:serine hydrolase domain-containing protein [Pedobacter westerhofensis]SMO59572.1 CubicO group peptidase, beta-lactamase class C family [Pedobacter westerhofensis]
MIKFIFPVLFVICFSSFGQQRLFTDKAVADLAGYYNGGHYTAIYNQFAPQSRKLLTEENVVHFYKVNLQQPLGVITSWKYLDEVKTNATYMINFERGRLMLKIAVSKDQEITYSEWIPTKQIKEIEHPKNTTLIKTNNPRQSKLDLYVDTLALDFLKDPNNSGLSIGIVDGNTTATYYYGETKKETNNLPNEKSLYEIGSISKTFTAVLLAHAINEKKIALTDDIRKYLPGAYPNLLLNGEAIRIVNLANHTSGLPRLPLDFNTSTGYNPENPYLHYSKEMIYQYLKSYKPDSLAGIRSGYSNLGFAVLGAILENVYQQPLQTLLKKVVTEPLKLVSTYYDVPGADQPLMTTGYSEETGKAVSNWQLGAFNAAGGLKSNMQDMLIYLKANINDVNPDIVLSHKETDRQAEGSIGLAWTIDPFKGNVKVWHNGATGGFWSWCGYVKNKKTGIVVLSNSSADVDDIALGLLSFSLQHPVFTGTK